MPTYSISVLKHQQRTDGKFPVSIRVTHDRKSVYLKTDYYVVKQQLNKAYEVKDKVLLKLLLEKIEDIENIVVRGMGNNVGEYSAKEIVEYIKKKLSEKKDIDFIVLAKERIEDLKKEGRKGSASHTTTSVNALMDFAGKNLNINNLTSEFLKKFEKFLLSDRVIERLDQFGHMVTTERKATSTTGVRGYMSDIRTIFNLAVLKFNDEDTGDIVIKHNPFKKYKLPQEVLTEKRNIKIEDVQKIMNLELDGGRKELGRDVFMLSFFLVGINTVDLFNMDYSALRDDRLVYSRTKTMTRRQDKAVISIKIEPEMKYLIEKYADPDKIHVFNFYKMYNTAPIFNANVNKGLAQVVEIINKEIKKQVEEKKDQERKKELEKSMIKDITAYFARHSWATIARNVLNISTDDISLCLNHVNEGHKVTDIYIEKDFSKIDRANRKMIDLVLEIKRDES